MAKYKVKVERKTGTADGWIVQCFHWRKPDDPDPKRIPLLFSREKKFYIAEIDIKDGVYSLVADLRQGVKISLSIAKAQRIIQPLGSKWPVTLDVPTTQTRDIFPIYFEAGVDQ